MDAHTVVVCGPDDEEVSLDERTRALVQIAPGDTVGDLAQAPSATVAGSLELVGADAGNGGASGKHEDVRARLRLRRTLHHPQAPAECVRSARQPRETQRFGDGY